MDDTLYGTRTTLGEWTPNIHAIHHHNTNPGP
jgi:hypothetical protein